MPDLSIGKYRQFVDQFRRFYRYMPICVDLCVCRFVCAMGGVMDHSFFQDDIGGTELFDHIHY